MQREIPAKNDYRARRNIPADSVAYADPESDLVAYAYVSRERPALIAYVGKAGKPCAWYHYASAWARFAALIRLIVERRAVLAERKARRDAAKRPHSLEVGHVFVASWGYDQTNVDYYQVVRIVGPRMVEVRKIRSRMVESGGEASMSGRAVPEIDDFCGEPARVLVNVGSYGPSISPPGLGKYASAGLWNGRPNYVSWYA